MFAYLVTFQLSGSIQLIQELSKFKLQLPTDITVLPKLPGVLHAYVSCHSWKAIILLYTPCAYVYANSHYPMKKALLKFENSNKERNTDADVHEFRTKL